MNHQTLHHCHFDEVNCINQYIPLVKRNDAAVIYTNHFTFKQFEQIKKQLPCHNIYLIVINNDENIPTISYSQLIKLINIYHINFTWK
jgi:hypothetical protein